MSAIEGPLVRAAKASVRGQAQSAEGATGARAAHLAERTVRATRRVATARWVQTLPAVVSHGALYRVTLCVYVSWAVAA